MDVLMLDGMPGAVEVAGKGSLPLPLRVGMPDEFQTPPEALEPLWSYLPPSWVIWEPACGKGNIVNAFCSRGYRVLASELYPKDSLNPGEWGDARVTMGKDFLTWAPADPWRAIVTNPPYSLKDEFLARCYALGRSFALLMPLTALEGKARQALYRRFGLELIIPPERVRYETPNGTKGKDSSPHFASAWFTWGLNLPSPLTFWERPTLQPDLFSTTTPTAQTPSGAPR